MSARKYPQRTKQFAIVPTADIVRELDRRSLALEFADHLLDEIGAGLGYHLHESTEVGNHLDQESEAFAQHFASAHSLEDAPLALEIYRTFFRQIHARIQQMGLDRWTRDGHDLFDFSHWTPEGDLVLLQYEPPY